MIKSFAQDIAKIEVGKDWPYSFVRRNSDELGCTWFDGFDIARKRADNASRYRAYYELIGEKIEKYDILPCNTYNVDEKGFLLGVINRTKRDGNRSWITFLACVCQDLTALPPFLIYQGKPGQVQDSWLTEFDPEHQAAFSQPQKRARNGRDYRLLITDGHSSHVNMDFLEWCDQHRIIVAVFPPHSTHRLQPLDVSLFGPLSTAYTNQLIQWTAKTQGLIGLSKREFWSLFWNAFGSSFSAENIASGWKRTGLLPFDPEVVLSQIAEKTEDESESGDSSVDSLALQQPTARDLRRLVDKVVDGSSKTLAETVGSSKYSRKSQSQNELLRYENQGLRETIFHEKQRRMRGKALKDYLFDRVDPNSAQVFSPAKVAQARLKKAAMETQKQEEALEKERQRRQAKEARQQEREKNRQIRKELKRKNQKKMSEMGSGPSVAPQTREKSPGVRDEIVVAISAPPEPTTAPEHSKSPNIKLRKDPKPALTTSSRPKKPSLAVERDQEMVVAMRGLARSGRHRKRPRWLDDCEVD
ncbi:DDE superfamily endonuclease domain-containing protein [Hirsutella rhossiliensis]|uniref:DDE superfamily endonuclease domain-containing protein n=1 Tax=Hirsutella rhossiliensis TaxID=111463 RepID=A0A9P8MP09_9HYPO|nr:DDE superfamily endonuclease domain-containing protein [Hirsutella rhossiliensis]KAH0959033.1 DDE superfamily endonuclease domain-containing protein [Hirsutella rhossiliensis]